MTGPAAPTDPAPEAAPPAGRRAVVRRGPSPAGVAVRVLLTILGAAGLIVGAFLAWLRRPSSGSAAQQAKLVLQNAGSKIAGTHLSGKAYFSEQFHVGHLLKSAGLPMIVLGLIALIGLAPRSGWLTRLAGALGIVAFILFAIEVIRSPQAKISNMGIGAWMCLVGAVLALIGGFFGTRPVVEERFYGAT
jgi:hypothetical protein